MITYQVILQQPANTNIHSSTPVLSEQSATLTKTTKANIKSDCDPTACTSIHING